MLLSPIGSSWKRQQRDDEDKDLTISIDRSACLIRHAGRALIRGRFRRVWRPRYLELWDNGLVRYYELPLPATSNALDTESRQEDDKNNLNSPLRLPKATLRIFHARILDGTTFRDMQVGLPHGSYGFLFHGLRENEDDVAKAALSPRRRSSHNQINASSTLSCHPTESAMMAPRDYMCAVDTLEEAQSWVVALQWAALQESNWSSGADTPLERGWSFDSCDHDPVTESTKDLTTDDAAAMTETSITQPSTDTFETTASMQSRDSSSHQRSGKIVITKCRRYRWVQVSSRAGQDHRWVVAYEIDLLLLVNTRRTRSRRKKRPSPDSDDATLAAAAPGNKDGNSISLDSWTVQEWSLLRTASEIEDLLENLIAELGSATTMSSSQTHFLPTATLDQLQRRIQALPFRQSPRHHFRSRRMVSHRDIQKSLLAVDSILRTMALEGVVVNSRAMKAFWGLLHSDHYRHNSTLLGTIISSKQCRSLLVWEFRNGTAPFSKQPASTIPPEYTMDSFVKDWLQEKGFAKTNCKNPTWWNYQVAWAAVWMLSTPYLIPFLMCVMSTLVLHPVWRMGQQYAMIAVTMRFDVLMLSYVMAVLLGAWWSKRVQRRGGDSRRVPVPSSHLLVSPNGVEAAGGGAATAADLDDTSEVLVDDASSTSIESFDLALAAGVVDDTTIGMQTHPGPYGTSPNLFSHRCSSPLPKYDPTQPELCTSCWSKPDDEIFHVRGETYLKDKVKIPSSPSAFVCRGVDVWITDNPERHIARHPNVLGGRLREEDTFLVNFLLPFANFVAYFTVPPISEFPNEKLATVWTNFLQGDQQYRDARLKLLPVVVEGPWIVKAAVGPGTSPALLGKVIPLQYFFREPDGDRKGVYEVDVIITASTIAKGILSVVKGHTKSLTIAFAFIVEAAQQEELPETVLCAFQVHALHLEDCPILPTCNLDQIDV